MDTPAVLNVLLFDVDGVLVEPIGYRRAINATLQHMLEQISLPNAAALLPSDADIDFIESCGIHDVWDITVIAFCQVLTVLAECGMPCPPAKAFDFQSMNASMYLISKPEYRQLAAQIKPHALEKKHPPALAQALLDDFYKDSVHNAIAPNWLAVIRQLLSETRSAHANPVTRLFQNIVLGGADFESTYGFPSEFDGESLLRTADRAAIEAGFARRLCEMNRTDSMTKCAVYTARPSLPPAGVDRFGYSPEAEIAAALCKMQELPLVGMGAMDWLASLHGRTSIDLTKPNTTQAWAALLAAFAGRCDREILLGAYRTSQKSASCDTVFGALKGQPVQIWVFEDTMSGILPMFAVRDEMQRAGYTVDVKAFGIATDKFKRETLATICESVYDDVNQALEAVLERLKGTKSAFR